MGWAEVSEGGAAAFLVYLKQLHREVKKQVEGVPSFLKREEPHELT